MNNVYTNFSFISVMRRNLYNNILQPDPDFQWTQSSCRSPPRFHPFNFDQIPLYPLFVIHNPLHQMSIFLHSCNLLASQSSSATSAPSSGNVPIHCLLTNSSLSSTSRVAIWLQYFSRWCWMVACLIGA